MHDNSKARLFAGVALARTAIKIDGRLPRAAGRSAAFSGVGDGATAGRALLNEKRIGDAYGAGRGRGGLDFGTVEESWREVLGFRGPLAKGNFMTFRLAPRAYRVVVACGFVSVFRAKVNLHIRMKRVRTGQGGRLHGDTAWGMETEVCHLSCDVGKTLSWHDSNLSHTKPQSRVRRNSLASLTTAAVTKE